MLLLLPDDLDGRLEMASVTDSPDPAPPGWRPELAEGLATFALVFAGCGAIAVDGQTGQLGHLGIALTFTFVIAAMVYATGHVSGAHINPAITVAFATAGAFPWRRVPRYIGAQALGALLAAALVRLLWSSTSALAVTTLSAGVPLWKGLLIEALATGVLAFVIAAVATDARAQAPAAGLAIGLSVGVGALLAGPMTGGSLNPARSLGPALVAGELAGVWVYLVAPVIGAVAAMAAYDQIRGGRRPQPPARVSAPATIEVPP